MRWEIRRSDGKELGQTLMFMILKVQGVNIGCIKKLNPGPIREQGKEVGEKVRLKKQ